jgi:hypothetical protein
MDHSVETRDRLGPAMLAALTLSLLAFPVAFNLGAYDQVLYPDVFRIMVASLVLLGITFLAPAYQGPRLWLTRVALASPTVWALACVVVAGSTGEATGRPFFIGWLALIVVISVPVTLVMLLDMYNPGIRTERNRRILLWLTGIVLVVVSGGYVAGAHNDRLMTCGDFAIAGSAEPSGCAP